MQARRPLSPREHQVAKLLRGGCSYAEVALLLGLTHGTVRTFAERAYRKLGVISRRELPRLGPPPA